jgi:hypothetical protein
MPKIIKRTSTNSTMLPNDRPIVAGSAREKALIAQRVSERAMRNKATQAGGGAPSVKRAIKSTTTTTATPKRKSRGFPKLKAAASKRAAALKKIK